MIYSILQSVIGRERRTAKLKSKKGRLLRKIIPIRKGVHGLKVRQTPVGGSRHQRGAEQGARANSNLSVVARVCKQKEEFLERLGEWRGRFIVQIKRPSRGVAITDFDSTPSSDNLLQSFSELRNRWLIWGIIALASDVSVLYAQIGPPWPFTESIS